MQLYAYDISFATNQSFWFCVEPNKQFSFQLYRQGAGQALIQVPKTALVGLDRVTNVGMANGRIIYQSQGTDTQGNWQTDWDWPSLQVKLKNLSTGSPSIWSAPVAIVAYEVDSQGNPLDLIGQKVVNNQPIYPYPPDSGSMALIVARSDTPATSNIAYIIPVATYQAYNFTGGGCFYGYPPVQGSGKQPSDPQPLVTMRRPGGGLGALLGEPPDPYDPSSPRQQFAHWDAKFISWLYSQGYVIDFYTDQDLDDETLNTDLYQLILSVGHHEYWSANMRANLQSFLKAGGNYACFSGNTCYRGIDFEGPLESQIRNLNTLNASDVWGTVGLCFQSGGGKWGTKGSYFGQWSDTTRNSYGFYVDDDAQSSWVFAGSSLSHGGFLGTQDYLVGYEADGVAQGEPNVTVLATSPVLQGFDEGSNNFASMVLVNDNDPGSCGGGNYKNGVIFNAGTSDWARVLYDSGAKSHADVVAITQNVIACLSARPDDPAGKPVVPKAGQGLEKNEEEDTATEESDGT